MSRNLRYSELRLEDVSLGEVSRGGRLALYSVEECRKHANGVFMFRRSATQKGATQGGGPESRNFRLQSKHSWHDFLQQRAE